jgi:hypothetical protein
MSIRRRVAVVWAPLMPLTISLLQHSILLLCRSRLWINNCYASNACYSVHPQATLYHDALQLETRVQFYLLSTIPCSFLYPPSNLPLVQTCSTPLPLFPQLTQNNRHTCPTHSRHPFSSSVSLDRPSISHSTISFVPSTRSDHRRTTSPYISPTPCALTFPIRQTGNGNPCSSQLSSPFKPDLRPFA